MTAQVCPREGELLDALGRGFVPVELAAHADGCRSCAELRLVAGALLADRAAATAAAPVPAAGTVWWRLQLRHRQEARLAARRSLLVGQGVSLVVALALLVAIFGAEAANLVRAALQGASPQPLLPLALFGGGALALLSLGGLLLARRR